MFDIPLLVTRPEIKAVAERLSKKTGSAVTPAQVLYDHPLPNMSSD